MLRASSLAFEYPLEITAVIDPSVPTGIPGGNLLLRLVDAVLADSEPMPQIHGEVIDELGPEALVDAAAVLGNFEMMNRVAEASGIPVPNQFIDRERELVDLLDIERFIKH